MVWLLGSVFSFISPNKSCCFFLSLASFIILLASSVSPGTTVSIASAHLPPHHFINGITIYSAIHFKGVKTLSINQNILSTIVPTTLITLSAYFPNITLATIFPKFEIPSPITDNPSFQNQVKPSLILSKIHLAVSSINIFINVHVDIFPFSSSVKLANVFFFHCSKPKVINPPIIA